MPDLDNLFDYADILSSSTDTNGTILLQTGSVDGAEVRSEGTEIWFPPGYVARPAKATADKDAAQGVCIVRGDQDICIATKDIRANNLIEVLGPGEVQIFAGGPDNTDPAKIVLKNDGSGGIKITITAGVSIVTIDNSGVVTIKTEILEVNADEVNVNASSVLLGNGASLGIALADPIIAFAAGVVSACAGAATPITITPLAASVKSGTVIASG